MKNMRWKRGFMASKIDLKKAYDELWWDFMIDTLREVGLPSNMVSLVQHYISSTSMQLLWKREKTRTVTPTCGIR